ncbi:hypothetical protein NPIL_330021 [Nephila pilipes]|uniref:Uncharacterized protein n=1 Tax=Nephila pilipes TaxID=299642 RepID=A0A8X6P194_NEPPI|nr:hypothetical protein NPIL_330021 [Nephila pilipes]
MIIGNSEHYIEMINKLFSSESQRKHIPIRSVQLQQEETIDERAKASMEVIRPPPPSVAASISGIERLIGFLRPLTYLCPIIPFRLTYLKLRAYKYKSLRLEEMKQTIHVKA